MHSNKFGLNAVARQPMVVMTPSINMAVLQLHLSIMILDIGPGKCTQERILFTKLSETN